MRVVSARVVAFACNWAWLVNAGVMLWLMSLACDLLNVTLFFLNGLCVMHGVVRWMERATWRRPLA
jgi:hypothetical protein